MRPSILLPLLGAMLLALCQAQITQQDVQQKIIQAKGLVGALKAKMPFLSIVDNEILNPLLAKSLTQANLRKAIEKALIEYEKKKDDLDFISLAGAGPHIKSIMAEVESACGTAIKCSNKCEFGYVLRSPTQLLPLMCPGCTCRTDPCKGKQCASDEKCRLRKFPPVELQNPKEDRLFWIFPECRKVKKPGSCPSGGIAYLDVSSAERKCNSDDDCAAQEKCCAMAIGTKCVPARFAATKATAQANSDGPTRAARPTTNTGGSSTATQPKPPKKCPPRKETGDCHSKLDTAIKSLLAKPNSFTGYIPRCNWDGSWQRVQYDDSTGIAWCADSKTGKPDEKTRTRGVPDCKASAAVPKPDVCGGKRCPRTSCIFRRECSAYPTAECRVNPCKNCQLEFYLPGKRVNCYEKFKSDTCVKERDQAQRRSFQALQDSFLNINFDEAMYKMYTPIIHQLLKMFYGGFYDKFASVGSNRLKFAMDIFEGIMKLSQKQATGRRKRSTNAVPSDSLTAETKVLMTTVISAMMEMTENTMDCLASGGVDAMIKYAVQYGQYMEKTVFQRISQLFLNPAAQRGLMQWSSNYNGEAGLKTLTTSDFGASYADSAMTLASQMMKILNQQSTTSQQSPITIGIGMLNDEFAEKLIGFGMGMLLSENVAGFMGVDFIAGLTSFIGRSMSISGMKPTGAAAFKAKGFCKRTPFMGAACRYFPCDQNANLPETLLKESWKDMFYYDPKTDSCHKYRANPMCALSNNGTLFLSRIGCETLCGKPDNGRYHRFVGPYIPKCEKDGTYSSKQSQGGMRWCVNTDGKPFLKSLTTGELECGVTGATNNVNSLKCGDGSAVKHCATACKDYIGKKFCAADPCNNCKLNLREIAVYKKETTKPQPQQKPTKAMLEAQGAIVFVNAAIPQAIGSARPGVVMDTLFYHKLGSLSFDAKKALTRELILRGIKQTLECKTKCSDSTKCGAAGFKLKYGCPDAACTCAENPCKKAVAKCSSGTKCVIYKPPPPFDVLYPITADCRSASKPGQCPCNTDLTCGSNLQRKCVDDSDCPKSMKCCSTGGGAKCVYMNAKDATMMKGLEVNEMNGAIWLHDPTEKNVYYGITTRSKPRKCDSDKECNAIEKCIQHNMLPSVGSTCTSGSFIKICSIVYKARDGKKPTPAKDNKMGAMCNKECEKDDDCADMMKCHHRGCNSFCMCAKTKLGPCHLKLKQQLEAFRKNPQTFLPRCKGDGTYQPMQLHDTFGVSWCVEPDGTKKSGFKRGEIDCSSKNLDKTDQAVCPAGDKVHNCHLSTCMLHDCPGKPSATCRINPCSGCKAEFFIKSDTPVGSCDASTKCMTDKLAERKQKIFKVKEKLMRLGKGKALDMMIDGLYLRYSGRLDEFRMKMGDYFIEQLMKAPQPNQTPSRTKRQAPNNKDDEKDDKKDDKKDTKKPTTTQGQGSTSSDATATYMKVLSSNMMQFKQKMKCKQFGVSGDFIERVMQMAFVKAISSVVGKRVKLPKFMGDAPDKTDSELFDLMEETFMRMPGPDVSKLPYDVKAFVMKVFGKGKDATTMTRPELDMFLKQRNVDNGYCGAAPDKTMTAEDKMRMSIMNRWNRGCPLKPGNDKNAKGCNNDVECKGTDELCCRSSVKGWTCQKSIDLCTVPPPDLKQCEKEKASRECMMNKDKDKETSKETCMPAEPVTVFRDMMLGQISMHKQAARRKYFYDPKSKTCVAYDDTGCGKDATNFLTKVGCEMFCMKKPLFVGRYLAQCDRTSGNYVNVQSMDGMSWCVDGNGKFVDGTLRLGNILCDKNGKLLSGGVKPQCSSGKTPKPCTSTCHDKRSCMTTERERVYCVADPCNDCSISWQTKDGKKATGTCFDEAKRCTSYNPADYTKPDPNCQFKMQWYYDINSLTCKPFTNNRCDTKLAKFDSQVKCELMCKPKSAPIKCSKSTDQPKPCYPCKCPKNCQGKPVICDVDPCTCIPKLFEKVKVKGKENLKEIKKCDDVKVAYVSPDDMAKNGDFQVFSKTCMTAGTDHDKFKKCQSQRLDLIMKMPSHDYKKVAHQMLRNEHLETLLKCTKDCSSCTNKCSFGFAYKMENGVMCQDKCKCAPNDPCKQKTCANGEKCVLVGQDMPFGPFAQCMKTNKPGKCPCMMPLLAGACCAIKCNDDSECPHMQKCCSTGCGRSCLETGEKVMAGYLHSIMPMKSPNPCMNMMATPSYNIPKFDPCKVKKCATQKDCGDSHICQAPFSIVPTSLRICCPKPVPSPCPLRCGPNQMCKMEAVQCIRAPCPMMPKCVDACPLKCSTGKVCKLQKVQCASPPCHPVPTCMPVTAASTSTSAVSEDDRKKAEDKRVADALVKMGLICRTELGSCHKELNEKVMKMKTKKKVPDFMPRCNKDGSWKPVQCYDQFGICFCVNEKGERLKDTAVRGIPDCSNIKDKKVDPNPFDVCQGKGTPLACDMMMCYMDSDGCPKYPTAVCRVNPCGDKCKVEYFVTGTTAVTDCFGVTGSDTCPSKRQAAKKSLKVNHIVNMMKFPMVMAEMMKYKPDLVFLLHSGLMERVALIFSNMVKDVRAKEGASPWPSMIPRPPQCMKNTRGIDERLKLVDEIMKCTKFEVMKGLMVDLVKGAFSGQKPGPGSKKVQLAGMDEMFKDVMMAVDRGMKDADPGRGRGGKGMGSNEKNKMMSGMKDWLGQDKKDGRKMDMFGDSLFAIDAKKFSFLSGMAKSKCHPMMKMMDDDMKKKSLVPYNVLCNRRPHIGRCEKTDPKRALNAYTMYYYDSTSTDCKPYKDYGCSMGATTFKTMASCRNFCQVPKKTLFIGNYVPQCNEQTHKFEFTQTSNGLSWCANENGQAVAGTLYLGWDLKCTSSGKATPGPTSKKVTCHLNAQPKICDKQCKDKVGDSDQGLVFCTADPCNNCQESWVNAAGDQATPTDRCTKPKIVTVDEHKTEEKCIMKQYYFDPAQSMCVKYYVDKCSKNLEKRFNTPQDCAVRCGAKLPRVCKKGATRMICGVDNCKTKCDAKNPMKNVKCKMDPCDNCKAKLYHSETWKEVTSCSEPAASSVDYMVKYPNPSMTKLLNTLKACKKGENTGQAATDIMYFFLGSKNMKSTAAVVKMMQAKTICDMNCKKCDASLKCKFGFTLTCGCKNACKCSEDPCKNFKCKSGEKCHYAKPPHKFSYLVPECRPVGEKPGYCPHWPTPKDGVDVSMSCKNDADCMGSDKCCSTGTGSACMAPYIYGMGKPTYSHEMRLKHIMMAILGNPCGGRTKFDWANLKTCTQDKDCATSTTGGSCKKLSPKIDDVVCRDIAICCPWRKEGEECNDQCKKDTDCMGGRVCQKTSCGNMCKYPCKNRKSCHYHLARSMRLYGLSKCEVKTSLHVPGLPRCNADGSWKEIQLDDATGMSWCVNPEDGTKIPGTLKRGIILDCKKKTSPEPTICPGNAQPKVCSSDLCNMLKSCKAYPSATCRVNPCGDMCKVQYHMIDANGKEKIIEAKECMKKMASTACGALAAKGLQAIFMDTLWNVMKDPIMMAKMEEEKLPIIYLQRSGLKMDILERFKLTVKGALSNDIKLLKDDDDDDKDKGKKDDDDDDKDKGKKDDDKDKDKGKKDDDKDKDKGKKDDDKDKGKKDDDKDKGKTQGQTQSAAGKDMKLKPMYDLGNGLYKVKIRYLKQMIKDSLGCSRDLIALDMVLGQMLVADKMKTVVIETPVKPGEKTTNNHGRSRRDAASGSTTGDEKKPVVTKVKATRVEVVKSLGHDDDYVVINLNMDKKGMDKKMMMNMPLDVKINMLEFGMIFGPPPPMKKPMMDPKKPMPKKDEGKEGMMDSKKPMPKKDEGKDGMMDPMMMLMMVHDRTFRQDICKKTPCLYCRLGLNVDKKKYPYMRGQELYYYDVKEKKCKSYIDYGCQEKTQTTRFLMKSACQVICEESPAVIGAYLPMCSKDKKTFKNKQCHGLYCFCVDSKTGKPNTATITSSNLDCDANGKQVNKDFVASKCPNGNAPQICTSKCLGTCDNVSPGPVVCTVDPCNGCREIWLDTKGNPVKCETARTDSGFDAGNTCKDKPKQKVWYFDKTTKQCLSGTYNGCGGNANRFKTECICLVRGNAVMCPKNTGTAIKVCDRVAACKGKMCHQTSSIVCTVDRCTCKQVYVDTTTGKPVQKCDKKAPVYDPCSLSPVDGILKRLEGHKDFAGLVTIMKSFTGAYPADMKIIQKLHDYLMKATFSASDMNVLGMAFGVWVTLNKNKCLPDGSNCNTYKPCTESPCAKDEKCVVFNLPWVGNNVWKARDCRKRSKPGMCPCMPYKMKNPNCVKRCHDDSDCPMKQKCCSSGCGSMCMIPLTEGIKMEDMCKKQEDKPKPCKGGQAQKPGGTTPGKGKKPAKLAGVCQKDEDCATGFECKNNFCRCGEKTQPDPTSCHGRLFKVQKALKMPNIPAGLIAQLRIPRCNEDNTYQTIQVDDHLGLMYCVDPKTGKRTSDKIRGRPDCTKPKKTGKDEVCPNSAPPLSCNPSMCDRARCPDNKGATCLINPCGKECKVEFFVDSGKPVSCTTKHNSNPCYKQLLQNMGADLKQKAENHWNKQDRKLKEKMIDALIMARTGIGMKSSGTSGKSKWASMMKLLYRAGNPGDAVKIAADAKKKSDEYLSAKAFQCAEVGSNVKQMYISMMSKGKGNMVAVDDAEAEKLVIAAVEKVSTLMYESGMVKTNKMDDATMKKLIADFQKLKDPLDMDAGICKKKTWDPKDPFADMMKVMKMQEDMICNLKRPSGEFWKELMEKPRPKGNDKVNSCPPVKTVGTCDEKCSDDSKCPTGQKCCSNGCGHVCMKTVLLPVKDVCELAYKDDSQCKGKTDTASSSVYSYDATSKKCVVRSLKQCQQTKNSFSTKLACELRCMTKAKPIVAGVFIPKCDASGYSPKQQHSGFSWCVDKDGKRVKGKPVVIGDNLICPSSPKKGTASARPVVTSTAVTTSPQAKCPNGKEFKTCDTTCATIDVCVYPEPVVCVSDPCNDCTVQWITKSPKSEDVTAKCKPLKSERLCPGGTGRLKICPSDVCDTTTCKNDKDGSVHCIPDCDCTPKLYRYNSASNRVELVQPDGEYCTGRVKTKSVAIRLTKLPFVWFTQVWLRLPDKLLDFMRQLSVRIKIHIRLIKNVRFTEGSTVVSFTVTAPNADELTKNAQEAAKTGDLKVSVNGTTYSADPNVKVTEGDTPTTEGPAITPITDTGPSEEKLTIIIFGSVIGGICLITLILLIVILVCRKKARDLKKKKYSADPQKFANPGFNMSDENYKAGQA